MKQETELSCKSTLYQCLKAYNENEITSIINSIGLEPSQNIQELTKQEKVRLLKKIILERITCVFDFLPVMYMFYLIDFTNPPPVTAPEMEIRKILPYGMDEELHETIESYLQMHGYIFNPDGTLNPCVRYIVPTEVSVALSKYSREKAESRYPVGYYEEFGTYAKTLTSLYGICTIDVFMKIYLRDYHKKNIYEKNDFLELMKKSTCMGYDFYFKDDMLINSNIDDDSIKYILTQRQKYSTYFPSKKELKERANFYNYDVTLPETMTLVNFLREKISSDNEIMTEVLLITTVSKLGYSMSDVLEVIKSRGFYEFKTKDEVQKFLEICTQLTKAMHLWTTWGWSLNELNEENQINQMAIAKSKKIRSSESEHVQLPFYCTIPTHKQIAEAQQTMHDYIAYSGDINRPLWFNDYDNAVERLLPSLEENYKLLNKLPSDFITQATDQWLASLYHRYALAKGELGDREWNYEIFTFKEHIGDGLFICAPEFGNLFVLYSKSAEAYYNDGHTLCLSVLVDMGGWYMPYGIVLGWKGFIFEDFIYLSRNVNNELYRKRNINRVIQFNPTLFWISFLYSEKPMIKHNDIEMRFISLECHFHDNIPPIFPKIWEHRKAEEYDIWTNDDLLNGGTVFFNNITKEVTVLAYTMEGQIKTSRAANVFLNDVKVYNISMQMLDFGHMYFGGYPRGYLLKERFLV